MHQLTDCNPTQLDATLVQRIYAGEAVGCVVRRAVAIASMVRLVDNVDDGTIPPKAIAKGATVHGTMLAPTQASPGGPTLDVYLKEAKACSDAWPAMQTTARAVHDLLAALAGVPVEVPTHEGKRYAVGTLRTFSSGAGAPLHRDRYAELPCRAHLERALDTTTQLSWYVVVAAPKAGGELTIVAPGSTTVTTGTRANRGDLVVFDGARYAHRVEPTRGDAPRRTFGGFAGYTPNRQTLHAWG